MALATGVEAPLTAIAQLGQLGDDDRRRFGRGTLALTIAIVGLLTLALTALAVHLGVGIPAAGATQIADIARAATGDGAAYALFQASSAVLLLSAASSSFAAGPGLLRALSRTPGNPLGILPATFGRTNAHHTPYWAVLAFLASSCAVVVAAGGREQELVLFYAVAVFVSFLTGLLAMARFSLSEGNRALLAVNSVAVAAVGFTLAINLGRGYPLASLAAALLIAGALYALWVRAGRPRGIAEAERFAEA
jgi:Amino acid permease